MNAVPTVGEAQDSSHEQRAHVMYIFSNICGCVSEEVWQ